MKVRVIEASTIHGITQLLEVVDCENPFLIGRNIIHQAIKKDRYIGFTNFRGDKDEPSKSWDEFRTKHNIKQPIIYVSPPCHPYNPKISATH